MPVSSAAGNQRPAFPQIGLQAVRFSTPDKRGILDGEPEVCARVTIAGTQAAGR